jgi:hypothetical protein
VVGVVGGGIGAIIVVGLWAWRFPELRLARSFDAPNLDPQPKAESAR